MKLNKLFLSVAALLIVGAVYFAGSQDEDLRPRYDRRNMTNMQYTKGIKKAIEYLSYMKGERLTGHIDQRDVIMARDELKRNISAHKALGLQWNEEGPDNVAGRTRSLCIDPNNTNTIYTGGVAGGLWKTTTGGTSWVQITDVDENLSISSIEMGPNGEIYVGTGESFANVLGNAYSTPGVVGTGIYKSTDGTTFDLLPSTIPSAQNSSTAAWAFVNRIAVNPNNGDVWAATNNGLKLSTDGGSTWQDPPLLPNGAPLKSNSPDVKVSPGGVVVGVVGNGVYISKTGQIDDFVKVSTGDTDMLPTTNIGRVEVAISDNDQVIYAVCVWGDQTADFGSLENIYMSDNQGDSWSVVGPGGSNGFQIFGSNNQGGYDNVIVVDPDNPYRVFVGGINMWEGHRVVAGQPYSWTQITQSYLDQLDKPQTSHYVHADHHVYKFHPNNPDIMFAGTDGGIFKTTNKGNTFSPLNKNFNITQFYTLAIAPDGGIMGGTQDNSTPYVSKKGNTPMSAKVLFFGDGGHAAFSVLNQDVFFVSSYYGMTGRSIDRGQNWELGNEDGEPGYYSQRLIDEISADGNDAASFVTPLLLWESVNVTNSRDSVWIKDTTSNHMAGDTLIARSSTNRFPFKYILNQNLSSGDSVQVADRVQSRFFLGTNGAVWMTAEALDFSKVPEWYKIADISGTVQSMVISEDGDVMYVGTQGGSGSAIGGRIYRISNIMSAWSYDEADVNGAQQVIQVDMIKNFQTGRWVNSIALDPGNKDHIIVTLGNYGESDYIYRSTDATSSNPTFISKQGDLPAMPVYAALIPKHSSNTVLIGTEYGVYATDDINAASPAWAEENTGLDRVPVFMIKQQNMALPWQSISYEIDGQTFTDDYPGITNSGKIYAATHGRGFFSTDKYVGIEEPGEHVSLMKKINVNLYPNPVMDNHATVEVELDKASTVSFRVFDISGRLMSVKQNALTAGNNKVQLDVADFENGTYILQVIYDDNRTATKRFVVM